MVLINTDPAYLFVYGTLMKGYPNPLAVKLHANCHFQGFGSFSGKLYLADWYPAALHTPGAPDLVYGEIYKLTENQELIRELDDYEDVFEDEQASLYVRRKLSITTESGETLLCWVYLYNQPVTGLKIIESGNFRDWQGGL